MKTHTFLFLLLMSVSSITSASPSIEGPPIGYKKYYRNGYVEIKCDAIRTWVCSISVRFRGQTTEKSLDLKTYGYINASEPIGAFLDDEYGKAQPIHFYFATDCVDEDYVLSKKSVGEVKCAIYGHISKKELRLDSVEVTSVFGDDFRISRGLTPLNP